MKVLHTIFFLLLIITTKAQTTYYVSLSGDNNSDGLTETTAWRTFSFAASSDSPVQGGDTVFIKAGDYGAEDIFIDKNYMPDEARISFIGYRNTPGDITEMNFTYGDEVDATLMPLYNPGDRNIGEGIQLSNVYSITIKNIQITNSLAGISIWNSSLISTYHVLENIFLKDIGWEYSTAIALKEASENSIQNCLIVNATGAGMDLWGDDNLVEDCQVYCNESQMVVDGTYTSMDYYIVLKGDNSIVRNCYAERDGDLEDVGHGLEIKESGENNLFVNCTVKNMIAGCFSVRWSGVQNNEFRNCTALGGLSDDVAGYMVREGASNNVFNACKTIDCEAGIRFLLAGEDADFCGENNRFYNCIFQNAEWVVDLNPYFYNSAPSDNNLLMNCVIDNAHFLLNCERPNTGNQWVNCIVHNVDDFLTGDNPSNFIFSYCDFYNNSFTTPIGTGVIDGDPLFVDAEQGDYHLSIESPCVDTGTAANAPATDIEGTLRPQGAGYDMGVYEMLASGIEESPLDPAEIYPNPSGGKLYFDDPLLGATFHLYSSTGQWIQSGIILSHTLDISEVNTGTYILTIVHVPSKKISYHTLMIARNE